MMRSEASVHWSACWTQPSVAEPAMGIEYELGCYPFSNSLEFQRQYGTKASLQCQIPYYPGNHLSKIVLVVEKSP